VCVLVTAAAASRPALSEPVARQPLANTPPKGWSSWNAFGCGIDEVIVRQTADALVSSGMAAAGYRYVNVDDCWMAPHRDRDGRLAADPHRFPGGMMALGNYLHARGLKFGIYSSSGTATGHNLPGSIDHEAVDAATFAEWGADLLKYGNCHNEGRPATSSSRSVKGATTVREWASWAGAHYWRTTGDISGSWDSILSIVDRQQEVQGFRRPNGWNDPDMLEIGNGRIERLRISCADEHVGGAQCAADRW
jgi:alpha-galactosidase